MTDYCFYLPDEPGLDGGAAYFTGLRDAMTIAGHRVWTEPCPAGSPVRVIEGMQLRSAPLADIPGLVGLVHHTSALANEAVRDAVRAAERERLPLLRHVVATSRLVGDRLVAEFGVDPAKLTIIPPGVPDAPRGTGSGGPGCTVLSVGALAPRKGHAVLIRALQRLFDLPWRLVIVGAARRQEYADELRALAGETGQVVFAGALDDAALDAAWRSADLFALATEWEGHCAGVAEALRRGLPVAVTAGGAAAELVTPSVGVICEPGDVDGLSKAMRRLIFDTALRADMAEAAWQAGQALPTWRMQAERFVEATCC